MAAKGLSRDDIDAQIAEIQSKKKELQSETEERSDAGLGNQGFFDQDIYGKGGKFEGYVTSIAPNELDDADDDESSVQPNRRGVNAPAALLNDIPQADKDYDPFAEHRRPTVAERENDYRAKHRQQIISPERLDPFADVGRLLCRLD